MKKALVLPSSTNPLLLIKENMVFHNNSYIGSGSRISKVSVSEGVVSVSNGQVPVSVSDDEVLVSVLVLDSDSVM